MTALIPCPEHRTEFYPEDGCPECREPCIYPLCIQCDRDCYASDEPIFYDGEE